MITAKPYVCRDPSSIPPRNKRGNQPIEQDKTPVKCLGESLDVIWWRGRQWAVTAYGIEALDGRYAIAADQIGQTDWPQHVTSKEWVDIEDFLTAWLVGIALHGVRLDLALVHQALMTANSDHTR